MKKRILLAATLVSLVACSSNTTASVAGDDESSGNTGNSSTTNSSSVRTSSGSSSGSGNGSSSSYTQLPDVDSSLVAGPSDLKVSSFVGPHTIVLTWTDISTLPKDEYTGYKIFRNDNYTGWDSVGVAPVEQQFFRDNSFDTIEYKSIYRIVAYKTRAKGDTLLSRYSNEAGVVPVSSMGFGEVIFDSPDAAQMVRFAPSVWDLAWTQSGTKPELGFVVQALRYQTEYQPVPLDTGDTFLGVPDTTTGQWLTSEANWFSLDTLGEADNHFMVKGPVIDATYYTALFRVYAYYNDEFGAMISEFTSEVEPPTVYKAPVVFTPPEVFANLISGTPGSVDFSWNMTHSGVEKSGNRYTDTTYWEYELLQGGTYLAGTLQTGVTALNAVPTGNICSISLRVRLVWIDIYGGVDRTAWSATAGTKPGTQGKLTDKAKVCKE